MGEKSVTFLMPGRARVPIGGYKVVGEYANRLADDGFDVHIIYPINSSYAGSVVKYLKAAARLGAWMLQGWSMRRWFKLNPRVKEHLVPSLAMRRLPKTNFYVATAIGTSHWLNDYKIDSSRKLYLIQGFETWSGDTEEQVFATYRYDMRKLVVARWLQRKVEQSGESAYLLLNGFDFDKFSMDIPPADRSPYRVCMMYHVNPIKGVEYGMEALQQVKRQCPQLQVDMFGVYPAPKDIPEWIRYTREPSAEQLRRIYNENSIYLATGLLEGWGLTVGEAMQCGAAVVCTDTDGYREMVTDGETGLIVPLRNAKAMADALLRLITDNDMRIKLAFAGNSNIQQFRWDKSYNLLRSLLALG